MLSVTPEAGNVPNAESVVVHPQNFARTQTTRGALIHRDSALDTNLTQLHTLEGSQQGMHYLMALLYKNYVWS